MGDFWHFLKKRQFLGTQLRFISSVLVFRFGGIFRASRIPENPLKMPDLPTFEKRGVRIFVVSLYSVMGENRNENQNRNQIKIETEIKSKSIFPHRSQGGGGGGLKKGI